MSQDAGVMGEVMRDNMDAGGVVDWANEPPAKPTWEQIVAMQKESAALRAQAAAVLPSLTVGATPRARRAPSRTEYPLFVPSYMDAPLHSGNLQDQIQDHPTEVDTFRRRTLEHRRYGSGSEQEIAPVAESGYSANQPQSSAAAQRHAYHSNRRSHSLSFGLSPEISQLTGVTPKSAMSGKSDGTNLPVTPGALPRGLFMQDNHLPKKKTSNIADSSSKLELRATAQARDIGNGGRAHLVDIARGNHMDTTAPLQGSSWKGCSETLSTIAPFADNVSAAGSGLDAQSPQVCSMPDVEQSAEKPRVQQSGLFGFLFWGRKASNAWSDRKKTVWEKDSNKDLERLIKSLQSQLEQSEKLRVCEVRQLEAALKITKEKFEHLQVHCRDLELQLREQAKNARPSGYDFDIGEDDSSSLGSGYGRPSRQWTAPHPSLTPELFDRIYDDAVGSMRKLSRSICHYIRELGESASQVITAVLENHSIAKGRLRKTQKILYFESFLNQIMFENFENVNFESSGGAPVLDPKALQHLSFRAFQELQTVTWVDIEQTLDEQGVVVNHSFHQFFVVRMEVVLHQLGDFGESNVPGFVISAFFDAIKAVWLLHHLAFSFRPAATILRVCQGAKFEPEYMEQVHDSDRETRAKSVFLMINPGFIIDDWVVKCRVYCSSK